MQLHASSLVSHSLFHTTTYHRVTLLTSEIHPPDRTLSEMYIFDRYMWTEGQHRNKHQMHFHPHKGGHGPSAKVFTV